MTKKKTTRRKPAARVPTDRKIENKEQYDRFRDFAREVEASEDPEEFDRAFRGIVPPRRQPQ